MSRPANHTRPWSGAISPASSPISVVLPAPFGPITACSTPSGIANVISSEATTRPKRLVRPSIASSASVTAGSFQEPIDAAAREQHHHEKERPEHDRPVFRDFHGHRRVHERKRQQANDDREQLLEHQQGDR